MGFVSELRYPTKWYAKLVAALLATVFFAFLASAILSGFLLYRILYPGQNRIEINTKDFPGHPDEVSFDVPGVGARHAWFFPGLKIAPTIILCHGYQSSSGELLTLASALQDHEYNVLVFDFAGHGASSGHTTLGFRETRELQAAIAAIASRTDVDQKRFGLWGTNLGGYVALAVAERDPRVRALVVESVYDRPVDMLRLQIQRSGLDRLPLLERATVHMFRWVNYRYRRELPLSSGLASLAGVPKLLIEANDEPELAVSTRNIFLQLPEPREEEILPRGNYAGMPDDDKRRYENRLVSFFLLRLPPSGRPRR